VKKIMKSMTVKQGKKYNNPASLKDIEPFIEFHQLNRDEVRPHHNEAFTTVRTRLLNLECADARFGGFLHELQRVLLPQAQAQRSSPRFALQPGISLSWVDLRT
jgi:phosphatidylserine decarboxylase